MADMQTESPANTDRKREEARPLGGIVPAKRSFQEALEAAVLTDLKRSELHLDSDCCLPTREALSQAATL